MGDYKSKRWIRGGLVQGVAMSEPVATDVGRHSLAFIAGLHRSGTTPLTRLLAAHSEVSGFSNTHVEEDEGQHLQQVYPSAP